ncbi:hypothetical protein RA307_09885 [Xanthobacteraceae bacterium Astr-EGSB]|uniref:hypothetical protein n=1 Tax=Astrobacterium formosum TaxID=3069710 RepID=UPI0027B6C828|nr:hypothetical protein [Xanthobacteraceae bacterium Astr-EGSB]
MGCHCKERTQAIVRGASALARGDLRTVATSAGYVARTAVQDARTGALRTAAASQLARLKGSLGRR